MKLKIKTIEPGYISLVNAETDEAVENIVHVRFECDAKHGWLGYIIFCPELDVNDEFTPVLSIPPIRGYVNEHGRKAEENG